MREAYDLLILGAGAAGSEAAFAVADGGRTRILLVESHHFGGTCTNHGCVPTKALVKAARVAQAMRTAPEFGFNPVDVSFDWGRVVARTHRVRDHMLRFGRRPFDEAGVDVAFPAEARLIGKQRVTVDGRVLRAEAVVLATGLEPLIPPIPGLRESGYLDNESVLELSEVPRRMAVIGGGPIGCEFAQIFSRFGSAVTIVEAGDRLLPAEEPESADAVEQAFRGEGIKIITRASITGVRRTSSGRRLELAGASSVEVDEVLVAVGRELDGRRHGLNEAGIRWTPKGVTVDRHLRTSQPWAYGAGDVVGGLLFTHTASAMGQIAARNAVARKPREGEVYEPRIVPRVTFTDPEVASVGMTEKAARSAGLKVRVGFSPLRDAEKAVIDGQSVGHVKVVADGNGGLQGCHIVSESAGDMIHEAVAMMAGRVGVAEVAAVMHAYPTLSELMRSALSEAARDAR